MAKKALLSYLVAITIALSWCHQQLNASQNALDRTFFSQSTFPSDFGTLKHGNKLKQLMLSDHKEKALEDTIRYDPSQAFQNHSFSSFNDSPLSANILDILAKFRTVNQNEKIIKDLFLRLLSSHTKISSSDTHREMVTGYLLKISQAFEVLGIINSCSIPSDANFHKLITDSLESFVSQHDLSQGKNSASEHPFNTLLNILSDDQGRHSHCKNQARQRKTHKHNIQKFVSLIEPNLLEYVSSKIFPLQFILSAVKDNTTLFRSGAQYVCNVLNITYGVNFESCESKAIQITENLGINWMDDNSEIKSRMRRSSKPKAIQGVKRNGYNGYGHYGGGNGYHGHGGYEPGYDDSFIIIPDEDEDSGYKHIYLIKILAAWAFGAYCLLGLLAYQTYFTSPWHHGRPGLKGPPGPIGDKGIKGDKGIPGDKGMPGDIVPGDPGEKGDKGEKGAKGPPGNKGATGPTGPTGPPGPKGTEGSPGADNMSPGATGAKGEKGTTGPAGGMGAAGPAAKRRRRDLEEFLYENKNAVDLTDSAFLLRTLYEKNSTFEKDAIYKKHVSLADTLNELWRNFNNPFGCFKCSLFDLLYASDIANIDPYIIAGFAHVLGDTGSLKLLQQIKNAKARGIALHCKRKKATCTLEYGADDAA